MFRNLLAAMMALILVTACQTGIVSQDGDSVSPPANDNASDNSNDNPPPAEDPTDGEPLAELTESQSLGVRASVRAAESILLSAISLLPVNDLEAIVSGSEPTGNCPSVDLTFTGNSLTGSFEYGDGCAPSALENLTVAGSVGGDFFLLAEAFDLEARQLGSSVLSLSGELGGGYASSGTRTTFALNVNLTDETGLAISGAATVIVDYEAGEVSIADATIMVARADFSTTVSFEDILLPTGSSTFLPTSGFAEFQVDEGAGAVHRLELTFLPETPTNGFLLVGVDNGEPEFAILNAGE